jgi:hypothetical protein
MAEYKLPPNRFYIYVFSDPTAFPVTSGKEVVIVKVANDGRATMKRARIQIGI